MFVPKYEGLFGEPFWFISTLFQFYFLFVLLIKLKAELGTKKWFIGCCSINVAWWLFSAFVCIADQRIWGSFFLQHLWEFALGIVIAEYLKSGKSITIKTQWLIVIGIIGIGIAGVAKIVGGFFTAFNDIFASFGYGAIALFIYAMGCSAINKFIFFTSKISYELYLVHILVFSTMSIFTANILLRIVISLIISYLLAIVVNHFMKKLII